MTRYARAKGSKASNEKLPNEATPWHIMKQQLEENLTNHKEPVEKAKSAKELLAATQNTIPPDNIRDSWAEFENNSKKKCTKKNQKVPLNSNENNQNEATEENTLNTKSKKKQSSKRKINEIDTPLTKLTNQKVPKKNKVESDKIKSEDLECTNANETETDSNKINDKREKKSKKVLPETIKAQNCISNDIHESQIERKTLSKRQKRNLKKRMLNENVPNFYKNNFNNNSKYNSGSRSENTPEGVNKNFPIKSGVKKFNNENSRKLPKIRDDKEHKRRKADLGPSKMVINGVEVEIARYDGFPVKKEDADRLKELKQKMVMRGIPRKEIDTAMKLERRRAEKALARIRKCVCFHCRKAGHNLSDCPELGTLEAVTGICFKCGSTEHTHFECKVAKPTEYRFAKCFICREQGHIAKQCPDNPKGIYPQGGGCNICGDVTHLKKDCPDLIKEKEETTITAKVITNDNLESLEEHENKATESNNKISAKVVTF